MFHFKPTSSCRGRLLPLYSNRSQKVISIHSLYEKGDLESGENPKVTPISIHSLYVEGDPVFLDDYAPSMISIHSLYVEGDHTDARPPLRRLLFQSTPSMQRETRPSWQIDRWRIRISIHSLYAEGDCLQV